MTIHVYVCSQLTRSVLQANYLEDVEVDDTENIEDFEGDFILEESCKS